MSIHTPAVHNALETEIIGLLPALRAFARRFARSSDEADDLVQETLLRALSALDRYQAGTRLKSWLFTIMRNTFCTAYRKSSREQIGFDETIGDLLIPPPQEWAVQQNELQAALMALADERREALTLVAMGTSYEDAAEICGCNIGTIKSRVHRARQSLSESLGTSVFH